MTFLDTKPTDTELNYAHKIANVYDATDFAIGIIFKNENDNDPRISLSTICINKIGFTENVKIDKKDKEFLKDIVKKIVQNFIYGDPSFNFESWNWDMVKSGIWVNDYAGTLESLTKGAMLMAKDKGLDHLFEYIRYSVVIYVVDESKVNNVPLDKLSINDADAFETTASIGIERIDSSTYDIVFFDPAEIFNQEAVDPKVRLYRINSSAKYLNEGLRMIEKIIPEEDFKNLKLKMMLN
jgi:hypothetical protein